MTPTETRARNATEQEAAEASWRALTPAQLRAKVSEIERLPRGLKAIYASILATAVARHAPHLAGHLPPAWSETAP
jgi:hypothetical protein